MTFCFYIAVPANTHDAFLASLSQFSEHRRGFKPTVRCAHHQTIAQAPAAMTGMDPDAHYSPVPKEEVYGSRTFK